VRIAVAVVVSMLTFAAAAVGLAFVFVPSRDFRAALAYVVTLIAVAVGIAAANTWASREGREE
jgi:uncharacterized membrane protein